MKENILLVDDDVSILEGFEEILTESGYSVDKAIDEDEALRKLNEKDYHLAIVDIALKETNGIDLMGKIREKEAGAVVIALTGYPSAENATGSFRKGVFEFVRKPCDRKNLMAVVKRGLKKKKEEEKNNKHKNENITARIKNKDTIWKEIISDSPSCANTILSYAKRQVSKETIRETEKCEYNFQCLLLEKPNCCEVDRYVGKNLCFVKEDEMRCINNNKFSYGFSNYCRCPVRCELFKLYGI